MLYTVTSGDLCASNKYRKERRKKRGDDACANLHIPVDRKLPGTSNRDKQRAPQYVFSAADCLAPQLVVNDFVVEKRLAELVVLLDHLGCCCIAKHLRANPLWWVVMEKE